MLFADNIGYISQIRLILFADNIDLKVTVIYSDNISLKSY